METNKPQAGGKHTILWIILSVVVLLIAGFGLYSQLGLRHQPPVALPAVVRVKIPSTINTPVTTFTDKTSIQPQNGQDNSGAAVENNNSPEVSSSPAVNAAPEVGQMIADRAERDNSMSPPAADAPTGAGDIVMQKQEPSEFADNQAPVTGSSDSKPMAAADEPQSIGTPVLDAGQTTAAEAPQPTPAQQVQADPGPGSSAIQNPTPQADAEQSSSFTIQVGAYLTKTYADQTVSQLIEKGYDAYIFQRTDKKQRLWYLVRFGHFQDRVAASQVLTTFKDQERMDASLAITN